MYARLNASLFLLLSGLLAAEGATAASVFAEQSNTAIAVTIKTTPRELPNGAWEFEIVFDTHSGELNDDLMKSAALLDDKGKRHTPVQWEGAEPGGHHRQGVLRFPPLSPRPKAIELIITRAGEPGTRSFRWTLP